MALHSTSINRESGDLNLRLLPLSATIGLHDRLKCLFSWESQRQIRAGAIQVGKPGSQDYLLPSRLSSGTVTFSNDLPFLDVDSGRGTGDVWTGIP